ncbi:MAG: restriction endonuclease [Elusimicrobia bacterium]|nr:restriction endonuclease [Elusimicrobiota bacterium]
MAIPDFQSIMLPLLKLAGDGQEHRYLEAIDKLADGFALSAEERRVRLPSDVDEIFDNRVGWAKTFLKKAALVEATRRGYFKITDRGQEVLKENPKRIDMKFLDQFPEYRDWRAIKHAKTKPLETGIDSEVQTPEEALEAAHQNLRASLASDLLQQLKTSPPALFEKIVVELLVKMGYGGSRKDAGQAIGKSGDEGIDGIIKEDRLGLDTIFIQAKRWKAPVGRVEIQKFAGALQGQRANKGIFITTAEFHDSAREYAAKINMKIVLIDGEELARFMIDNNIGVISVASFDVKKVDLDYFAEE